MKDGTHVDLETWELFQTAMETGTLLQCSKMAGLSPSTVSRRLRELEDFLELQLFYRDNTGVYPTAAGKSVLVQIKPIVNEINEIRALITKNNFQLAGDYLVCMDVVLFGPLVMEFFWSLESRFPRLFFDFTTQGLDASLQDGPDIFLELSMTKKTQLTVVSEISSITVASPSYLEEKGLPQTPEDLIDHEVATYGKKSNFHRTTFQTSDSRISIPLVPSVCFRSAAGALAGALRGQYIALSVPSLLAADHLSKGELVNVFPSYSSPPFFLQVQFAHKLQNHFLAPYLVEEMKKWLNNSSNSIASHACNE